MSSNLYLKRVCDHCSRPFTARTTVTRFCSDECAKKNYKKRQKNKAISDSNEETQNRIKTHREKKINQKINYDQAELIDIKMLSAITSIGERTLYRLTKEKDFPKLK